mgnify:CR=1 FL=1
MWLNTKQMATLFDKEESNIRRHITNIFKEAELGRENNVHFLHFNGVKKPVPFNNLDVIISVGYREKSQRGVQFRQCIPIIFGTTFGTIFGTRKLFSKKYTHAETPVIQMLPRVVCPISLSTFSNLRRKTPSTPKIFAALL